MGLGTDLMGLDYVFGGAKLLIWWGWDATVVGLIDQFRGARLLIRQCKFTNLVGFGFWFGGAKLLLWLG